MIIVTGATGTIGQSLVKELKSLKARFKVVARDPDKAKKLLGDVEVAHGDLSDRASLDQAFQGGDKLFLLGAAGPQQVEEQRNAIEAAKQAGIKQVVKVSALGADVNSKVSLGRWHGQTEDELKRSGLEWTILQPHSFMQNMLGSAATIKLEGAFYGAAKDGKIAMIDTRDIARVAAHALVDGGQGQKTLVLTGGQAISYAEAAQVLSKVLGKPVKYVDLPPEQLAQALRGAGLPGWLADDLVGLNQVFAAGYGAQVTDAVETVGRARPHTFEEFVRDHAQAFA